MEAAAFFGFAGALVVAMLFLVVAEARMRKGLWKAHRSGTGLVWFDSDHGRLALDHSGRVRFQPWHHAERVVPLKDVRGLRFTYGRGTSAEALAEFDAIVSRRSGLADVLDRYELVLVTGQGDIPIFVAGQVFRRLVGFGWVSDAITDRSARRGLIPDVESFAGEVARELQEEFARRGHPLRLL